MLLPTCSVRVTPGYGGTWGKVCEARVGCRQPTGSLQTGGGGNFEAIGWVGAGTEKSEALLNQNSYYAYSDDLLTS